METSTPALTTSQQSMLAETVKGSDAELFVLLCLDAGLRKGEALGLRWGDIHLNDGAPYLDVRCVARQGFGGKPAYYAALKSKAACRSVPITQRLLEALSRRRGESGHGDTPVVPLETAWPTTIRLPRSPGGHVTPHRLRHTYNTGNHGSDSI